MIIWVDAQISPKISKWIQDFFGIESEHVSRLLLTKATDEEIFLKAKSDKNSIKICILTNVLVHRKACFLQLSFGCKNSPKP